MENMPQGMFSAPPQPGAITLRLPKIDMQMAVLLIIAVIAAFQSFQLFTLRGSVGSVAKNSASAVAPGSAPAGNGLQSMVGGC